MEMSVLVSHSSSSFTVTLNAGLNIGRICSMILRDPNEGRLKAK